MGSHLGTALQVLMRQPRETFCQSYIPLMKRDYGLPEKFLSLEGHRLCYIDAGQGPPVLLLHGLGANIGRWKETIKHLAKTHRVIAYDQPGFGKSDKPDISYSIPCFVEVLRAFIKEKKLTDFYLIGHSMGGAVVLEYLASRPPEVRAAMVIAPAGIRPPHPWWQRGLARMVLQNYLSAQIVKKLIASCVHVRNHLTNEMIAQAASLPSDPEWPLFRCATRRATLALLGYSIFDRLHQIERPVTIVWGEKDTLQPAQLGLEMHHRLPSAQLVVLPQCGHYPMLELPQEFNNILTQFLNNQPVSYEGCEDHGH